MRVVLDTNVIVSGVLTANGTCARLLDLFIDGAFEICADDRILDEYDRVLRRPEIGIDPSWATTILDLIRSGAHLVAAAPLSAELPDPDDLVFLEVAASAEASLVTGNGRHYPGRARCGVKVFSPREFLDLLRRAP